eukprot:3606309-Ditylum_brightwellii.AAC.1
MVYHLDLIIIHAVVEKEEGHLHPIVMHTQKKVHTPDNRHNQLIKVHGINNSKGHLIMGSSSSTLTYPKALNMNNDDFLNGVDSSTPGGGGGGGGGNSLNNNGGSMSSSFSQSFTPGRNENERSSNTRGEKGGDR